MRVDNKHLMPAGAVQKMPFGPRQSQGGPLTDEKAQQGADSRVEQSKPNQAEQPPQEKRPLPTAQTGRGSPSPRMPLFRR
jgi:hypothetical protein